MTLDDFRHLGLGEVVRRLEHAPARIVVKEYLLQKMVEKNGERIVQARAPGNVVDGGAWGPSVYAHVGQERALGRVGFAIARSVLCELFHRAVEVLAPIYEALLERVRQNPYVHADATKIRVAEPPRARTAWIWTALCEDTVANTYSETRGAETANQLLANTPGVLITDGYSA